MKILIDMNLSPTWVPFLSSHEIESIHWSSIGGADASDDEILGYAASNEFVVFTHDLDFGALLARRRSRGPSVLQIRSQDVLPSAIGLAVIRAISASRDHLAVGAIVTVNLAHNRIRLLPI
jgi:predicted nuclease of predicted toxin-antitoxin system